MSDPTHAFRFTLHAVERFCERICPEVPHVNALPKLQAATAGAVLMFATSVLGDFVYSVADPPMLWIAKHEGGEAVVVTIVSDPGEVRREREEARAADERFKIAKVARPELAPLLKPEPSPSCPTNAFLQAWTKNTKRWLLQEGQRVSLALEILKREPLPPRQKQAPPAQRRFRQLHNEEIHVSGWGDADHIPWHAHEACPWEDPNILQDRVLEASA